MSPVLKTSLLVLFPLAAAAIGAAGAAIRPPGAKTTAAIQHFAAGVVFAAVAGEVLPDLRKDSLGPVTGGFAAGVIVLLALRRFSERAEEQDQGAVLPIGLLAAIAIDLAIDGLLVGSASRPAPARTSTHDRADTRGPVPRPLDVGQLER